MAYNDREFRGVGGQMFDCIIRYLEKKKTVVNAYNSLNITIMYG